MDYEILGVGNTQDALDALTEVLQSDPPVVGCVFVTAGDREGGQHLLVMITEDEKFPRPVVIRSGFTSGYGGEGPVGTSLAITLLDDLNIRPLSVVVDSSLFERIDQGTATYEELRGLWDHSLAGWKRGKDVSHYVLERDFDRSEKHQSWRRSVAPRLTYSLVSPDLFDLIPQFERNPREALIAGFRRLESEIRAALQRVGVETTDRAAVQLIRLAFGKDGRLRWADVPADSSEHLGRVEMLAGAFQALRNKRAHEEDDASDHVENIQDFYVLSRVYEWGAYSVVRD